MHRERRRDYGKRPAGADACAARSRRATKHRFGWCRRRSSSIEFVTRLRLRHRSPRTEASYVGWIRRFILFNDKRHPREMGAAEIERFLTSLAVDRKVSASTQNQALAAVLFLYREVLRIEVPWMEGIVRARRPDEASRRVDPPRGRRAPRRDERQGAGHGDAALRIRASAARVLATGASRTSTSRSAKSWFEQARATRTG